MIGVRKMNDNIDFKINGKPVSLSVDTDRMLLWVLRTELGLTGAKYGCGEGFCGTCTVLVDDEPVRSCQYPVKNVRGKDVLTIEGLASNGELHPLQKAFIKSNAMQCGFCTSGMILEAYSLLKKKARPTRPEIITALDDHLCRCSSYHRILQAVEAAAQEITQGGKR
ncbi:MAG: (2Fe-2S)-binding protein [Clostridiales bacterium]|nr:(2Fe-2S)-binding protein [Clostridiales bacterium]